MEKHEIRYDKYPLSYIDLSSGETIAYRMAGSVGRTFLLIHGNLSSSIWFEELMDELSKDNIVYALDLPGFGDSSYKRIQISLYDISRDVTDFILKLGLKDINLLGWSTGGGIALETAATIPERISSIILLSSVGLKGYPMYKRDFFAPFSMELIRTREEMFQYNALVGPVLSMFRTQNKYLMKGMMERIFYVKKIPDDDFVEKCIDGAMKQRNYVDILTALVNFNMTNSYIDGLKGSGRADLVKAPIHIIHGDCDQICDLDGAEFASSYFGTQADLKIFRGCGHSILTDDFEGVVNYIRSLYQ